MDIAKLSQISGKIVELVGPLDADDRQKIFGSVFALLGEAPLHDGDPERRQGAERNNNQVEAEVPAKVKTWLRQNEVGSAALEQAFHIEKGKASYIGGDMPGRSLKEKTINAYVLAGLANFLSTGEAKFTDNTARLACSDAGCYDAPNHVRYVKAKSNYFTGSKDKGWTLTAPGLKYAASLIKGAAEAGE